MQKVTSQPGKVGTQLLNLSSVQLVSPRTNQGQIQTVTKPLITKNNAPILTGVKLVNTQQGGKYEVLFRKYLFIYRPVAGLKIKINHIVL